MWIYVLVVNKYVHVYTIIPLLSNRVDTHHKKGGRPHRPDFTARTLTTLHGIVELDWKREMEKERQQLVCSHVNQTFSSMYYP